MNVQWSALTLSQQQALREIFAGAQTPVHLETEEQLRNLGLAEREGNRARISQIGVHLLPGHLTRSLL